MNRKVKRPRAQHAAKLDTKKFRVSSDGKSCKLDVEMRICGSDQMTEEVRDKELIKGLSLPLISGYQVALSDFIGKLAELGYKIGRVAFLYFVPDKNTFTHWGVSTSPESGHLPLTEIQDRLILRIRKIPDTSSQPEELKVNATEQKDQSGDKKGSSRNKERKIDYIIEKVSEWRKLYTGTVGPDGKIQKLSLEEAARKVGIAKKTLDDYLLQLRAGRKYGFDFNKHKQDKVGALRAFVKKEKESRRESGRTQTEDLNEANTIGLYNEEYEP